MRHPQFVRYSRRRVNRARHRERTRARSETLHALGCIICYPDQRAEVIAEWRETYGAYRYGPLSWLGGKFRRMPG